jgi:hypothetical protein
MLLFTLMARIERSGSATSYEHDSVNMSAYAGQTGTLGFYVDDSAGDGNALLIFDDITLQ